MNLKYFTEHEFRTATPSCRLDECCEESLERLDLARELARTPFIINSAYRTRHYELSKGRSGNSAHTLGRAFDIRCHDSAQRWRIVNACIAAGFSRIGIAPTFIHVDDAISLPTYRIWLY